MKKVFKLLCYSLITVFLLGLGGEKVFAAPQSFTAVEGTHWIDLKNPTWWSTVKRDSANPNSYVFCLDSNKHIFTTGNMILLGDGENFARTYNSNYQTKVANVINEAFRLGLGDGNQNHTITYKDENGDSKQITVSDVQLYGIAQSAVWYAAHGESYVDGGYTAPYKAWIENNGFSGVFEKLITTDDFSYSLNIVSDGNSALSEDNGYLVSGEYTIVSNIPATLTATVTNGEMKVGNGEWTSNSVTVQNGQKIQLRKSIQGLASGEISIKLEVSSDSFITGYDVSMYYPEGFNTTSSKYQNLAYPTPKTDTKKSSVTAYGNHEQKGNIQVQKVSTIDGQEKLIEGAHLSLYRSTGSNNTERVKVADVISKTSPIVFNDLPAGDYCLREDKPAGGYVINTEEICNALTDGGTLSLKINDPQQRVKYRKVNEKGEPISGVRIEIHDYFNEKFGDNSNLKYICAISDENGYLTRQCPEASSNSKIVSPAADGTFPIRINDYRDEGVFYYINEEFKKGYYNPKFAFGETRQDFSFVNILDKEKGVYNFGFVPIQKYGSQYLDISGQIGVDAVVTVSIINDHFVNVSKVSTSTGDEIPGAEMVVWDLGVKEYSLIEDLNLDDDQVPFAMADKWTSDGTPHTIRNIVPGHTYRLEEVVQPNGYDKLTTNIDFKVDEEGNVELLTIDQHASVSKDNGYLIIGNDLQVFPPNTGISLLNKIAVGGLLVFVGYEVIKIYRKRANS